MQSIQASRQSRNPGAASAFPASRDAAGYLGSGLRSRP
jgi:hypothetical protein